MSKIHLLSQSEFTRLKKMINGLLGGNLQDRYAFSFIVRGEGIIIINKDADLSDDERAIVLWHEKAHADQNIEGEEDSDRWALKHLTKPQQKLLKANWPGRHGHPYRP